MLIEYSFKIIIAYNSVKYFNEQDIDLNGETY